MQGSRRSARTLAFVLHSLVLFCMSFSNSAQAQTVQDEFNFVMYLVGNGMKEEAVTAVNSTLLTGDSIDFAKGYAYYSARLLDSAVVSFDRVEPASHLFNEAALFSSLSNAHLGHYNLSADRLSSLSSADTATANLLRYELAGVRLLQRDLGAFESLMSHTDTSDYRLATEARDLWRVHDAIAARGKRSPWVAGALSAVVPGLGKVYAGNFGEGIASFLLTGSLIAITAENWIKESPTNWKTIAAGLLSAVFYVGNIYGSVASVKINMNDFNHRNNVQILYDIHIPLRASYRH